MPVAHDTDIAYILAFVDFQGVGLLYPATYISQAGYRPFDTFAPPPRTIDR